MNQIFYFEPLSRAYERMMGTLFRPFDLSKWFVVGFGCWLANLASCSGGGGSSSVGPMERESEAMTVGSSPLFPDVEIGAWLIGLVGCVVVFALALFLLIVWLSARGRFIFLDNVVRDRGAIKDPWKRYKDQGNSLFLWELGYAVVVLLIVLLVALPTVLFATSWLDQNATLFLPGVVIGVLLLVVGILGAAFVHLMVVDFVVPIMFRESVRILAAWRLFLPLLRDHFVHFLLYSLLLILLWLGVLVGLIVVILGTCCLALVVLIIPYIGTVAMLPIFVTFRAFSLEFLRQFSPSLDVFATGGEAEPIQS